MTVELVYFKPSGKWYTVGYYETEHKLLFEVWEEVRRMADARKLPGLIENHSTYLVLVTVPEHEHNHPHLIVPEGVCKDVD